MLAEVEFTWSEWDAVRSLNILLCVGIIVALLTKGIVGWWARAEPADRVLMLGVGWFGIATTWGAVEASLQNVHGGSRVAFYTLTALLLLVGILLPRNRDQNMIPTQIAGEPSPTPKKPGELAKFYVPALLAVLVILQPLFQPGTVWTPLLIGSVVIAVANAPVVYYLGGTRAKTWATAIAAGLQVILAAIDSAFQWSDVGSISYETWVAAALAIAGIFGVALIPNAPAVAKVENVTPLVPVEAPGGRLDVEDALDKQERVSEAAAVRREHHSGTGPTPMIE